MNKKRLFSNQVYFFLGCIIQTKATAEWIKREDHYYYFSNQTAKAEQSQTACVGFGTDLLSITDEQETEFIHGEISGGYWCGLYTDNACGDCETDSNSNACRDCRLNKWKWRGDTQMVYENWEPGEPDKPGHHKCGRLLNNAKWRSAPCGARFKFICKTKDHCLNRTCNHGTCKIRFSTEQYECICNDCYEGRHCDILRQPCGSNPCQNGGTCRNDKCASYSCDCPRTYTGVNCESDVDECERRNTCMNGATCENTIGGFICNCTGGWSGVRCDKDSEEKDLSGLRMTLYIAASLAAVSFIVMVVMFVNDRYEVYHVKKRREDSRRMEMHGNIALDIPDPSHGMEQLQPDTEIQ